MRVGIGDAERLKVSRLPPHPSGLRPCPPTPSGLRPSPPVRGSRPSPLWGEGFCSAQIGGNCPLCGTFGYIYWELWWSAPVGGGRPGCAAPTERRSIQVGILPPHPPPSGAPSPRGEGLWSAHCAPLRLIYKRLYTQKKGQVWDLSLKTQKRNAVSHKISLLTFFQRK